MGHHKLRPIVTYIVMFCFLFTDFSLANIRIALHKIYENYKLFCKLKSKNKQNVPTKTQFTWYNIMTVIFFGNAIYLLGNA